MWMRDGPGRLSNETARLVLKILLFSVGVIGAGVGYGALFTWIADPRIMELPKILVLLTLTVGAFANTMHYFVRLLDWLLG